MLICRTESGSRAVTGSATWKRLKVALQGSCSGRPAHHMLDESCQVGRQPSKGAWMPLCGILGMIHETEPVGMPSHA